jgi:Leucine-rich repeat (LRR) protein
MIKSLSFRKIPLFPRDLHGNNFSGNIPDINALRNLQQLDLSGNQLTGQNPNLYEITCLETVKLSGNQLDSTNGGTNGLGSQECLTTLDLSNNNFFGPPPSLVAPFLQYLNLSMNKFDGPIILQSIFNYQTYNLTVLDLSQNNFNGTLPDTSFLSNSLQQL